MAKQDYQTLNLQLSEVLAKLQQPDIQVDEAIKLYEQGLRLTRQLEALLQAAENRVEKLKQAEAAAE